jgi:catechol 2,3-dioxygenase-like lactoylglutathione lyase family enzyme
MLTNSKAFSGFAVDDLEKAHAFYGDTLGLDTTLESDLMTINLAGDRPTLVYPKPDLEPGNYTILNFPVDDIDAVVDELTSRGVVIERYEGFDQDDKGIFRGLASGQGPDIAWFKDPAGNILSVIKES